MPSSITDALGDLIGENVTVGTDGGTFTGRIGAINGTLLVLCAAGGVTWINVNEIQAVQTV